MEITLEKCNPYIRTAEIQPAVLEGEKPRMAYDHRLFFVIDGAGKIFVENKEYDISNYSTICIPPAVSYHFQGKMRVVVINYDATRSYDTQTKPVCPPAVELFDKNRMFDTTIVKNFKEPVVLYEYQFLLSELTDIVTAFNRRDDYSDAICSSKLKSILTMIARQTDTTVSSESKMASKIDGYIHMYATEIESNNDIAHHFGYHPVYMASIYKKETGKTLHSAIIDERINVSCRWLLQTNETIDTIALEVGFSSRTHFCTAFKSRIGSSPSAWRRKQLC